MAQAVTIPSPFTSEPDGHGRFGQFGGKYAPETLMGAIAELERAADAAFPRGGIDEEARRGASLPEARGPGAYRGTQDQQRARARVAGEANGQAAHHRGDGCGAARGRDGHGLC